MIEIENRDSILRIFYALESPRYNFLLKIFFRFFGRYWLIRNTFGAERKPPLYIDLRTASKGEVAVFLRELSNINFYSDFSNLIGMSLSSQNKSYDYIFTKVFILDEKEYVITRTMKELVA